MSVWETGEALTKADENEVRRLNGKHRDIRTDGAHVLERMAVREELQRRRQAFVDKHQLSCFKCQATTTEWKAGGKRDNGTYWVICQNCIWKKDR